MPWYDGQSLMHHPENVHGASDRDLVDTRFPVQYVVRLKSDEFHDYRGYAGRVDVSRGRHDLPTAERPEAQPRHRRDDLLDDQRAAPPPKLAIKHTTRMGRALVKDIQYRLDVNTLHRDKETKELELELNEIGRVQLTSYSPLIVLSSLDLCAAQRRR
jgi:bifunctional enzyme CysN/CysC/sulfate adenylyltransferase subunit 1